MPDYDSPWKQALEKYFPAFMAFFFPQAHADIDWKRGYSFLDKELEQVVRDAELGKRLADKLVQVWRQDGEAEYILAHIEVQGQKKSDFAERMYVYNYRIYDRYRHPVASLAVLADEEDHWRPAEYSYELWGSRAGLRFPVVKLLDYREHWQDLEASDNPFATVVMAHIKAKETAHNSDERYRWKLSLIRRLYERGYRKEDILELFRFIDWVLQLPQEQEERLWQELNDFEARRNMQYVTSVERIGFEKGKQEGFQEGRQEGLQLGEMTVIKRLIIRRFGEAPAWVEERLAKATVEELEQWAERILDASSLEDVFKP
jgi:hypothetical protein